MRIDGGVKAEPISLTDSSSRAQRHSRIACTYPTIERFEKRRNSCGKKCLKLENRKNLDVQVKARPYHESTGSKKRSTVADTNTSNDMLVWFTVEIGLVETTKEEIMKT